MNTTQNKTETKAQYITLSKGTPRERQFDVNLGGQIPDLWPIAHLPELDGYTMGSKSAKDMILETWHLAHDLQKAIAEQESEALKTIEAIRNHPDWYSFAGLVHHHEQNQSVTYGEMISAALERAGL